MLNKKGVTLNIKCNQILLLMSISIVNKPYSIKLTTLTVGLWPDVKNGFTWKIIIVLKVRGGHGE